MASQDDCLTPTFTSGTTFWPGLSPYALVRAHGQHPDPSNTTLMDLATSAVSPVGLLPGLIPLYKIVHGLVLKKHRYDITDVATKTILALGALAGMRLLWNCVKPLVVNAVTCSYMLPLQSPSGKCLEAWIGEHAHGGVRRHRRLFPTNDASGHNPAQQQQYSTALQSGWLWFEGHRFFFKYSRNPPPHLGSHAEYEKLPESASDNVNEGGPNGNITVYAVRWISADALSRFMTELTKPKHDDQKLCTNIHTYDSVRYKWYTTQKPTRTLDTIDLDNTTKETLLQDIEVYLNPKRAQWYANRGIPYRRGYLFHGPPGTGKTSTSTALAGKFKGNLYIASLSAMKNDKDIKFVFGTPRKGDVLLLEDIDSAGIVREEMKTNTKNAKSGIKLADLLNAIDGVSGAEGIVLIMTTNEPERLDKALIRPGRIDRKIYFGEITGTVAKSIFLRMYQDDEALEKGEVAIDERVKGLAKAFAAKIPDKELTPAEVQTYLTYHTDAQDAVDHADQWIKDTLAAKAEDRNVIVGDFNEPEKLDDKEEEPEKLELEDKEDKEQDLKDDCEASDTDHESVAHSDSSESDIYYTDPSRDRLDEYYRNPFMDQIDNMIKYHRMGRFGPFTCRQCASNEHKEQMIPVTYGSTCPECGWVNNIAY